MRTYVVLVLLSCLCGHTSSQECDRELRGNVDFPGTDIIFVYSPDVQHCQQMCTQHPSCLFFTYVRADWTKDNRHFFCYLKQTSSGQPNVQTPLLGVTSGFSLKPCPENSGPCFPEVYPNLDFFGADYRTLFTPDYDECQRVCTHEPGCQFFTWVNGLFENKNTRYKCYLKFSWTVPVTPIVEPETGVVSGFSHKALASQSFNKECQTKYFPNTDIPGNDLLSLPAASPEHCLTLCSAHPACTFFSFKSTTCNLKKKQDEMVTQAKEGMTSGIPSRLCSQDNSWLEVAYNDLDFEGSDIRNVMLDDAESCQRTCTEDPHCQFYSYVKDSFSDSNFRRRCFLKRGISIPAPPKVTKLTNVVSGFSQRNCEGL